MHGQGHVPYGNESSLHAASGMLHTSRHAHEHLKYFIHKLLTGCMEGIGIFCVTHHVHCASCECHNLSVMHRL
eukprot:363625-Chlamydomonas_euryale.AAC.27